MNDQHHLADLERRMGRLERIELGIVEAIRLDSKASRELSMSEDVRELRKDVGEGNADANP
jgi:hypothetical protein